MSMLDLILVLAKLGLHCHVHNNSEHHSMFFCISMNLILYLPLVYLFV